MGLSDRQNGVLQLCGHHPGSRVNRHMRATVRGGVGAAEANVCGASEEKGEARMDGDRASPRFRA